MTSVASQRPRPPLSELIERRRGYEARVPPGGPGVFDPPTGLLRDTGLHDLMRLRARLLTHPEERPGAGLLQRVAGGLLGRRDDSGGVRGRGQRSQRGQRGQGDDEKSGELIINCYS